MHYMNTRDREEADLISGLNSLDRLCFFWIGLGVCSALAMQWLAPAGIALAASAGLFSFLWGQRASALFMVLGESYPTLTAWERFKLVTPLTGLGM